MAQAASECNQAAHDQHTAVLNGCLSPMLAGNMQLLMATRLVSFESLEARCLRSETCRGWASARAGSTKQRHKSFCRWRDARQRTQRTHTATPRPRTHARSITLESLHSDRSELHAVGQSPRQLCVLGAFINLVYVCRHSTSSSRARSV